MKRLITTPKDDGFFMPGEFEPHDGTIMIFPERPGSWQYGGEKALPAFLQIFQAIAAEEMLYLIVSERTKTKAEALLSGVRHIQFLEIPQDDAWARDTAPTFVRNAAGEVRGINWRFNAWGGSVDGLYADWQADNALAGKFCEMTGISCYDAQHFVLEGGSIHADGAGTLLTTERCLCSAGRNPHLSKAQITETLCAYTGAEKVIWLPRGIYNDETNEHVDNVCAFLSPGEVVLAWTDDKNDPQYPLSEACLETLTRETDARGRQFTVRKLPVPAHPVCITPEDLGGFVFAEGEDVREVGERLAASYVNFYFTRHSVLLPQFGGVNAESDALAVQLMQTWCPQRQIIPVPAAALIVGGGNIHCLTQQIPERSRSCGK